MSTYDERDGWAKRLEDSIVISKLLIRWASRGELLAFGFDPEFVEMVMVYRAQTER